MKVLGTLTQTVDGDRTTIEAIRRWSYCNSLRAIAATFLLVSVFFGCSADSRNSAVALLVKDGILEGPEWNFRRVGGSSEYIKTFGLSDEEQQLIGPWHIDYDISKPTDRMKGLGLSVLFLPNRLFIAETGQRTVGRTDSVIGEWKVVDHMLSIRLRARVDRVSEFDSDLAKMYSVLFRDSSEYYPIFRLPKYTLAFLNEDPFDFAAVPASLRDYYGVDVKDWPRYRILFDNIPLAPIERNSRNGKILFDPQWTSDYILALLTAWDYVN